jgi:hypothetical protein
MQAFVERVKAVCVRFFVWLPSLINRRSSLLLVGFLFSLGLILVIQQYGVADTVQVRVDRWLSVRQTSGTVSYYKSGSSRTAQVGDRLESVGDGVTTGFGASATLEVDTGIGYVNVSENTQVWVQTLDFASDNGRITHLNVPQGQVDLQVRSFTHEGSELEIYTPSSVSGVRGTQFGISVQPSGKSGIATREGAVATSASGETVFVNEGFQTQVLPDQPPEPPVPLTDDTSLNYQIERFVEDGKRQIRFIGQVDPVNAVLVDDEAVSTDITGTFTRIFPAPSILRANITVITPLGRQELHELSIPL